ncbi:condensation domain-containing protein [Streptomyces sp. NPDC001904]|uniref:condensation domain-containing protein n=1 Tax=Streptomyces sp. NPDC001904 TaxID=3154531 RepID=UPI00331849DC
MTEHQPHGVPPAQAAAPGTPTAGTVPLSEHQIALLHPAAAHRAPATVPFAIDLRGPLDERALHDALARLTARHPRLTARLARGTDGRPCLDVDPARAPVLEHATSAPSGHAPSAAMLAEARRDLDPARTGMLRAVLITHRPEHHTLLLVVHRAVVDGESAGLLLADLLDAYGQPPAPRAVAAPPAEPPPAPGPAEPHADSVALPPHQQLLLLDALAHRGTGRYVEQLYWQWHGPLDTDRFTAAWQSVAACETVLRAAFDLDELEHSPRIVVHDHVRVEVARHPHDTVDWDALLERDRLRGFDLREPGLLRATLLDEPGRTATGTPAPPSTRVLLTFHHVLLDSWSVSVLLQEFYRAYLADGVLAGRERRPDFRDHARWLAGQDTAAARAFWTTALPAGKPALRPGLPAPATGLPGWGRARELLGPDAAGRLRTWATAHAATESVALQAVWALLLYRAAGAGTPAPVGFGVVVSGRGIALDSVERLPGLLMNALPMVVRVDPRRPLLRLLADLRDRALDMACYEWVSVDLVHHWSGRPAGEKLFDSLVAFEHRPQLPGTLAAALAAQDIHLDAPHRTGAPQPFPLTLLATAEPDGSLLLTAVHDRARVTDTDARRLVQLCARLLRELPHTAGRSTTAGDVLATITGADLPRVADAAAAARESREVTWPEVPESRLVREAWQDVLGGPAPHPAAHAVESGAHPLVAVHLLRELNRRAHTGVRLEELLARPHAGDLARLLNEHVRRSPA